MRCMASPEEKVKPSGLGDATLPGLVRLATLTVAIGFPQAGLTLPEQELPGTKAGESEPAAWTVPRTSDGQPDLQGIWTFATGTPLERPKELGAKEFYTEEEAARLDQTVVERLHERVSVQATGELNEVWMELDHRKIDRRRRTSLIVDPLDGRIPFLKPLTEDRTDQLTPAGVDTRSDGPEDRRLSERCILYNAGPPLVTPAPANLNFQILQTRDEVVLHFEMIHDARIIPLDGRPHLPPTIRQWMGNSRGKWEGETLVVDTTNFTSKTRYKGSTENMHLVERFTRIDPDTILYRFTVEDPETYLRPWSAEYDLHRIPGPIFEYACHEGNRGMALLLSGARAQERAAEESAKKKE